MSNGVTIEGLVSVDHWRLPRARFSFLSHAHADHMAGLATFAKAGGVFHATTVTANLVSLFLKDVPASSVRVLSVGEEHVLARDGRGHVTLAVTLVDANHVPGAVMFLFQVRCSAATNE